MRKRLLCIATVIALACGACGSRADSRLGSHVAAAQPVALPTPVTAVPVYAVQLRHTTTGVATKIADVRGVATATAIAVKKVDVRSTRRHAVLRVAAVDPLAFRPLALSAARDAPFVWTTLIGNQAVLSYDAAHALDVDGSQPIRVRRGAPVSVGAFADTGVPNVADVLVSRAVGAEHGITTPNVVEVGAEPGASATHIAHAIRKIAPTARLHRLIARPPPVLQPSDPQPFGVAAGSIIGTMHYLIEKNGFIKPDPAWVHAYIVNAEVPILGTVTCNRLIVPQLTAALSEIERDGLSSAIDPADYGGCYVPRFVDRNPSLPLSMHAFGLALDLNVSSNPLGTRGNMDPRVVQVFEKWGFRWGGTFQTRPDPMHFELARLVRP